MANSTVEILIAEDDPEDQILLTEAWQEVGADEAVTFVGDGEQLLEYLRAEGTYADLSDAPLPGLVLLDLNMPRCDGREALAAIRHDPRLACIPVVVLTTSAAATDIDYVYSMGANSFIQKPDSFADLVDSLKLISAYWFDLVTRPSRARRKG